MSRWLRPSRSCIILLAVTLPWPDERAANDYGHAQRAVDHRRLTDLVWVAEARANSRVLHLARELMGQIAAVQAAEGQPNRWWSASTLELR